MTREAARPDIWGQRAAPEIGPSHVLPCVSGRTERSSPHQNCSLKENITDYKSVGSEKREKGRDIHTQREKETERWGEREAGRDREEEGREREEETERERKGEERERHREKGERERGREEGKDSERERGSDICRETERERGEKEVFSERGTEGERDGVPFSTAQR